MNFVLHKISIFAVRDIILQMCVFGNNLLNIIVLYCNNFSEYS